MAEPRRARPVIVAGAGGTGLGAAWRLSQAGVPARLVDPRPALGGMAATLWRGDEPWKPGVHLLHPSHDTLRPLVQELAALMGDQALHVVPTSAIHFLGHFLDYPFKSTQVLAALGPTRAAQVAASAAWARARGVVDHARGRPAPESFEQIVAGAFGPAFYGLFFRDYTAKVLGLPPARVAGAWARRRVPLPTSRNLLQTLLPWWRPPSVGHAHSPFHRTQVAARDGLGPLFEALAAAGPRPAARDLGTEVVRIQWRERRLTGVVLRHPGGREERVVGPRLIATLPLAELVARLDPQPPSALLRGAAACRPRGLVFALLKLRRGPLFRTQWTYFQAADLAFNRVSEHARIIPDVYGPGRTVVAAEITADPGERAWDAPDDEVIADTLAGLRRVAPDLRPEQVEDAAVVRERHAYPAWQVGFETLRDAALGWLDGLEGLVVAGRQGRFDYLNLDEAIWAGRAAAERLLGQQGR